MKAELYSIGFKGLTEMIKILSAFIAAAFLSSSVLAGSASGSIGKLEMGPIYGNIIYISVIGTVSTEACTNPNYNFALDISEPGQNATLSAILAAKAASQSVTISGTSQCQEGTDVEGIRWIRLE